MKKRFWQFRAAADDALIGELQLYGMISSDSWWGDEITPKQFRDDLDALGEISTLNVYINSDGGDVFAGQAIHSMLSRHKARIIVYVDGLAASIASVIAMAGDVVRMPRNAMMMIHNPWVFSIGNAAEFRKLADDLDKIEGSLIAAYAKKTNLDGARIKELLDAETWMTAAEAVEMGFADEIEEAKEVAASLDAGHLSVNGQRMDLSRYTHPPKFAFLPRQSDADSRRAALPSMQTDTIPRSEWALPTAPEPEPQTSPGGEAESDELDLFERRLKVNQRRLLAR